MASKSMIVNYDPDYGYGSPLNIRRGNPLPLDNDYIKLSYEDAVNYAQSDPTAYVGQMITVIEKSLTGEETTNLYQIIDTSGTLKKISSDGAVDLDEITEQEIDDIMFSVFGA